MIFDPTISIGALLNLVGILFMAGVIFGKIKSMEQKLNSLSYHGRTYEEGKKIKWKDGVRALYCIVKYNLFR